MVNTYLRFHPPAIYFFTGIQAHFNDTLLGCL